MNQPSNQSGVGNTFSSQQASQTNPFTADLKGEFTSNFGTNTNAVSQMFKEGGFVSNNRTKYIIVGVVVVLVVGFAAWMLMSGGSSTDEAVVDAPASGDKTSEEGSDESDSTIADKTDEAGKATSASTVAKSEPALTEATQAGTSSAEATSSSTGPLALSAPSEGASVEYDETQGPAQFAWNGTGGFIVFSRNQSMRPEIMRVKVSGSSYSFNHPWPGTWFWKVENGSGASEVRSFTVNPPVRRNVSLAQPAAGGSLAGNGGQVAWQGDNGVAYYRVELSSGDWANPQFKFSTRGNSVQLQGVTAGQYKMRIGAFSEVAGRWEYTQPVDVSVQ